MLLRRRVDVFEAGCPKAPTAPSAVAAITAVHIMRFIALVSFVGDTTINTAAGWNNPPAGIRGITVLAGTGDDDVSLRFGVNNVLDRKPPIVGFNANPLLVNGNMLAAMYDTLGRYIFIGATLRY